MKLPDILDEILKSAFRQSILDVFRSMSETDSSWHVAGDDDFLLRWESDELSELELSKIASHLEQCPDCFMQIGEMLRVGVLELPDRPNLLNPVAEHRLGTGTLELEKPVTEQQRGRWNLPRIAIAAVILLLILVVLGIGRLLLVGMRGEIASSMNGPSISVPDDSLPVLGYPPENRNLNRNVQQQGVVVKDGFEAWSNEIQTVFLYEERLGGELQPIDPKRWSNFGSINGFLERIVVFEQPDSSALAESSVSTTFRWTVDEEEAQWTLIFYKSPIGFMLKRRGMYSTEGTGIEQVILKGFTIFSVEPRPEHMGEVEEY